ncbi:MAG: hypothetical protein V4727_02320 [Verrucomicrobiota bacterium]
MKYILGEVTNSSQNKKIHHGFLFDPQPQSWPQEGLDFFLKKIRWIKIASVMQTTPSAMKVCQSMRLKAHQ